MPDLSINQLPAGSSLQPTALLVVYQNGQTQSITGAQLISFANVAISDAAKAAQQAAQQAQNAANAVENLGVSATTLPAGQPAAVEKTVSETGAVTLAFSIPQGIQGEPGASIQSVERTAGTGAAGTYDTYTITLTSGGTFEFQVYNGANGTGAGDFMANGSVPMAGTLQMGGNLVSNVGAPVSPSDAARLEDVNTKASPGVMFAVALPASGWADNQQTVEDARFLSNGYAYIVVAESASYSAYTAADIYAKDITTDGQITFNCTETPSADVTAIILREEVANG